LEFTVERYKTACSGWCVEAHDLAASKLVAFREKDRDFARILLREHLIKPTKLLLRISQLPKHARVTTQLVEIIEQWIRGVVQDIDSQITQ
jgi:hypothetical protein